MGKNRKPYEDVAAKAKRGIYDLVVPLDYVILDKLQDEGSLMGGVVPLATTVSWLGKSFTMLTPTEIASRLRSMQAQGLTVPVRITGAGGNVGWQRTKQGVEMLTKWQEQQGKEA